MIAYRLSSKGCARHYFPAADHPDPLRLCEAAEAALGAPTLVIRPGNSACRAMQLPGTGASAFDLCVTSGSFSHDRYAVRAAGRTVMEGTDDDTTRGIERVFDGAVLNLKCDPVTRLPGDVTAKTIEDAIESLKTSSPNASFDERKDVALSMHSVEVGRHCVLSRPAEAKAALDIHFPE